ncbi:mitogen-activated protein kinase kinase kinase 5-like isoform X2 [Asparagus officinalis]|uniref:mitogen-activated protein kinase kinase kinase 5-like isoform X2 n=1 Tax=Asparagus officinalis TaxID=4686 RepID=UPI00098E10A1|nr:mitogen-activated protein kinase kinase kinase 5-like isoform X2 [Asparagus officinalis]
MPWWKSTNSPSSSSSPRRNRNESPAIFSRRGSGDSSAQPRLTRQRKLRHLTNIDVAGASSASFPVTTSPTNLDVTPLRSSSSPVLLPQPLPLPGNSPQSPNRRELRFLSGGCRLPSPREGSGGDEGCWSSDSVACRLTYQAALKSPEHVDAPAGKSMFSDYRKALHDPNSVETVNFRLNIPAKSAPSTRFSSPVLSPRRSNIENDHTYNFPQGLLSPSDIVSDDTMPGSSTQSPGKVSPDCPSMYSPTSKSPVVRSRNPSAPSSPVHPKYPENSVSWHEDNGNANVHPLPLPPGAAVPSQSPFTHPNTAKPEPSPWQKQKLIGSGTFGNVYVATNRHTGALCAMKEVNIIPDDPKSAECLKQLEQEIEVLSQLKHPNIVQYYGSEMTEDRFFIYLEYVFPGSIDKYVRDHCGAMTESVVRNFTRHILRGLAYLHGSKKIHRDIKGANLLVDINGVVKLADFGMAKHVVQATMNKDVGYDYAVDIWSLGCTIIEMFTRKHPWSGLEGAAAMFKVLHKDPPIPDTLSSEGKDFLRRCFCRNPADRPTATMLLDHPFIRNLQHHKIHGSIQDFARIKIIENTYSPRDRTKVKSETNFKGKQVANDEAARSLETSESASSRISPQAMPEGVRNFFAHTNHVFLSPSGSSNNSSGVPLIVGHNQLYALPKPNRKEILDLF